MLMRNPVFYRDPSGQSILSDWMAGSSLRADMTKTRTVDGLRRTRKIAASFVQLARNLLNHI
ncbi:MAG: hypothetical protein ACK4UN_21540, partial [Limisphaerales bacterium]